MKSSTNPINKLVHQLGKLPGIGEKTATRLAHFVLRQPNEYARDLANALVDVKEKVRLCSACLNLTEHDPCELCRDINRDENVICVVEDPTDMMAIEKSHAFRGRYHILHGALSPLSGVGPDDIKIAELISRLETSNTTEIIIATNPNVEGEATALYLSKILKPSGLKLTRLASGIPVGGDLEYIDASTLTRAFEERREL
jgi:recombination protein RecR